MPRSEAHVRTLAARNHLTQLCAHFAVAVPVTERVDTAEIDFTFGTCRLAIVDDGLALTADAVDTISLARVEYLVGDHLERLGARDSLAVDWQPALDGTTGAPPAADDTTGAPPAADVAGSGAVGDREKALDQP
ncbi:DUF2218 domain-containing protein [Solwaraspora sp. WMMD791]|uniref:DUF2218 domain-containing protein n=1 Tax=Solwaraspora sp. WMMD791 TaxID=3016086 RepID=UPI00249B0E25|nr:DUF2218 domain-containing protein [Solwaraspora sp. WMMD791]WFE25201.1 DUF2218 domain-containing protein [Solwaraspora sp. WMMD791]